MRLRSGHPDERRASSRFDRWGPESQSWSSRASTGSIYWEGLARLVDSNGRIVGSGYLEMTGYAQRLRL